MFAGSCQATQMQLDTFRRTIHRPPATQQIGMDMKTNPVDTQRALLKKQGVWLGLLMKLNSAYRAELDAHMIFLDGVKCGMSDVELARLLKAASEAGKLVTQLQRQVDRLREPLTSEAAAGYALAQLGEGAAVRVMFDSSREPSRLADLAVFVGDEAVVDGHQADLRVLIVTTDPTVGA
jgi:hypothetical protein